MQEQIEDKTNVKEIDLQLQVWKKKTIISRTIEETEIEEGNS